MKWYQQTVDEVIKKFNSDPIGGLSQDQVIQRLKEYGTNTLPEKPRESWFAIFLRQFKSPLVYILLVAATIIFIVGEDKIDAFIISGILFFNAIIGTIQEGRTRNIVEKLKKFITADCIVIRNGEKQLINNAQLVPGDIVLLQEGERVPADVRIIDSTNLHIDEAALTGESVSVPKNTAPLEKEVPLADQHNMAFKGTYVLMGAGKGIVIATGRNTQIGTIQRTIEELEGILPLRREINRLSQWILVFVLVTCALLFVIGMLTGKPLRELITILTALFICVIPEGLPVVLTLVLVSGVYRMARRNILVKNMQAVEALGRTDVIVIDKTGTLTRNEMMVTKVFSDGSVWTVSGEGYHTKGTFLRNGQTVEHVDQHSNIAHMAQASILLNNAEISYNSQSGLFTIKGDPTEAALYVCGQKLGYSKENLQKKFTPVYEIPFDSGLNYHAGFYIHDNKGIMFIIGAPEFIIKNAVNGPEMKDHLEQFLEEGLRVVGIGMKEIDVNEFPAPEQAESERLAKFKKLAENSNLTFLGLCGIQDAIRPDVRPIVEQARAAGLEIIMATGDHKKTALYVARDVGIVRPGDEVVNGTELKDLPDQELAKRLSTITVYARVSPDNKLRIIKLLHKRGAIVAMTGDGINDVPSMVAADLGIAMGQIGTDVAKEAADIILMDDSFVHIVDAIKQGRHIFYTLRRVILYFFSTNMAEILIILFAFMLSIFYSSFPLPITAAQILWLNFVTDGFLDVALSTEPMEKTILEEHWLKRKLRLIDRDMLLKMLYMATPMAIGSLWAFSLYYKTDLAYAQTMTLITMAMFQWFNAWNCRSEHRSMFELGFFTNRWLIGATVLVLLLQLAVVEIPLMQRIFKTVPLRASDWLLVFILSSTIIVLEELRKAVVRIWANRNN